MYQWECQSVQKGFPNPQWEAGGCGSGVPDDVELVTSILD